jgi:hypothetical protein
VRICRLRSAALAIGAVAALTAGCASASQPGPSPTASPGAAAMSSAPVAHHVASAAVLAADLRAEGLPVRRLIVYTAATDPNAELGRQGGYTSKVAWVDRRAVKAYQASQGDLGFSPGLPGERGDVSNGGGIEVFPTAAQAQARARYIQGFGPMLADGYDYTAGGALLRLSKYLTPAQAQAYKADFTAAVGR